MKKAILWFVFLVCFAGLAASVQNPDTPEKGEWDFKLRRMWEVTRAGEEVIGRPLQVAVTENGHVVIFDVQFGTNRLFTPEGEFITSFGKRGEGPGEIKNQSWMYAVGDRVAVPDGAKVHYFGQDGTYLESLAKPFNVNVVGFIDTTTVLAAPLTVFQMPEGKARISLFDLKNRKEKLLSEFEVFEGGTGQSGGQTYDVILPGLSPLMTVGCFAGTLYYGMSNAYVIHRADLQGKQIGRFSLQRKKRPVSRSAKKDRFRDSQMPPDAVKQIVDSLPDEIASFDRIEGHRGLIYVFVADLEHWKDRDRQPKQIDIFSPEGRYLYRSFLRFPEGGHLFNTPFTNLAIGDGYLVAALEDTEGEVKLAKYRVTLPDPPR